MRQRAAEAQIATLLGAMVAAVMASVLAWQHRGRTAGTLAYSLSTSRVPPHPLSTTRG